jgi:glutathione synthase/RimK-type ligase-like ATP-grasp enzyme
MDRMSVLIPDVDEGLSLPVAHCLKLSGKATVHGLSRRRSRALQLSNLFKSFEYMEEFELSSWLKRIDEIVVTQKVDVVLPVTNLAIRALSEYRGVLTCADRLVQLPEPHILDTATNKASLSAFMAVHGLPQPPTVVVSTGAPRPEGLSTLSFPVLAKLPRETGGKGIRRFEDSAELDLFLVGQPKGVR